MKFENTKSYNFEGAFRGMRNPMNSWDKSDSCFGIVDVLNTDALTDVADAWIEKDNKERIKNGLEPLVEDPNSSLAYYEALEKYNNWLSEQGILSSNDNYEGLYNTAFIGPNDMALAQKLILASEEHAKFLRQIFVCVDITAPLYWWKQFDTYKIGTVANSTSTMHKLSAIPITRDIFEFDNLDIIVATGTAPHGGEWELTFEDYVNDIVDMCENLRTKFKETADSRYWNALVAILPNAYLQKRTITMSYANLRNIYFQRHAHKLKEWHQFCDEWIPTLPYAKELITLGGKNEIN